MNQRKMERIARHRRMAQGFGALSGVLSVFAILGAIYGSDMKEEAGRLASEAQDKLPGKTKELLDDVKNKLGK